MIKNTRFLFLIAMFSTIISFCSDNNEVTKGLVEVVGDGLSKIAESQTVFQSIVVVNAAAQLYPIAKDGVQYFFPTKEQILSDKKAGEFLDIFEARVNFRKCLFNSNVDSERTILNCPIKCKELARAFLILGGKDEIVNMVKDFNENWK
jgi:hypothetical protein